MNHPNLREEWVGSRGSGSAHPDTTALYQKVFAQFTSRGTSDAQKAVFIQQSTSLQDVERLVVRAKKDYESSRNQKLDKWLGRVSTRLMYFANVFDVLAQHHPEYVTLAWGAMKFLFVAVINHINAIAYLSKGISRIADALPRIELVTRLYPTKKMIDAVEELYEYILRFFIRAHDWYCEGKFRHILHSMTRPAELRYEDLVENIARCSRNIDQIAISGSQVELREVHESLKAVSSQLEQSKGVMKEMKIMMIDHQAINSSSLLDTNQRVTDLQFSEMVRIMSSTSMPDSTESFRHGMLMRKRRQMQNKIHIPQTFWRSPGLQNFSHSQSSSLALIKGNFRSRFTLRDAAVIITEELHYNNVPVLWAIRTGMQGDSMGTVSSCEVLKSLVSQALRLTSSQSEKSSALSCSRLQTASNETDWFQVLGTVLEGLHQQIYIMLDLGLLTASSKEELADFQIIDLFFNLFRELSSRGLSQTVKVMIFTYKPVSPRIVPREGFSNVFLSVNPTARPIRRAGYPRYYRRGGKNLGR